MGRPASAPRREERWRCFVAVPIADEVRTTLAQYVDELRREPWADDWRWTDPASWHITLAFLGSVSSASIPELAATLDDVASRHTPLTVETGSPGAFPSLRRPRVLWVGVRDQTGALSDLATDVQAALGVLIASPFVGHVTLARSARTGGLDLATNATWGPSVRLEVGEARLYRSNIRERGYDVIHTACLGDV